MFYPIRVDHTDLFKWLLKLFNSYQDKVTGLSTNDRDNQNQNKHNKNGMSSSQC
jgi:hypothetical protein